MKNRRLLFAEIWSQREVQTDRQTDR